MHYRYFPAPSHMNFNFLTLLSYNHYFGEKKNGKKWNYITLADNELHPWAVWNDTLVNIRFKKKTVQNFLFHTNSISLPFRWNMYITNMYTYRHSVMYLCKFLVRCLCLKCNSFGWSSIPQNRLQTSDAI